MTNPAAQSVLGFQEPEHPGSGRVGSSQSSTNPVESRELGLKLESSLTPELGARGSAADTASPWALLQKKKGLVGVGLGP